MFYNTSTVTCLNLFIFINKGVFMCTIMEIRSFPQLMTVLGSSCGGASLYRDIFITVSTFLSADESQVPSYRWINRGCF